MNQQKLYEKLKEAREIQDQAIKMAEESDAFSDSDFKKSNDLLMESIVLWRQGNEIVLNAISAAMNAGLFALTEEQEKKLNESAAAKQRYW